MLGKVQEPNRRSPGEVEDPSALVDVTACSGAYTESDPATSSGSGAACPAPVSSTRR